MAPGAVCRHLRSERRRRDELVVAAVHDTARYFAPLASEPPGSCSGVRHGQCDMRRAAGHRPFIVVCRGQPELMPLASGRWAPAARPHWQAGPAAARAIAGGSWAEAAGGPGAGSLPRPPGQGAHAGMAAASGRGRCPRKQAGRPFCGRLGGSADSDSDAAPARGPWPRPTCPDPNQTRRPLARCHGSSSAEWHSMVQVVFADSMRVSRLLTRSKL